MRRDARPAVGCWCRAPRAGAGTSSRLRCKRTGSRLASSRVAYRRPLTSSVLPLRRWKWNRWSGKAPHDAYQKSYIPLSDRNHGHPFVLTCPSPSHQAMARSGMDGKGAGRDNVFVKRLWQKIKVEGTCLKAYDSVPEARASIGQHLDFYNSRRPRSSLGGPTPDAANWVTPQKAVAARSPLPPTAGDPLLPTGLDPDRSGSRPYAASRRRPVLQAGVAQRNQRRTGRSANTSPFSSSGIKPARRCLDDSGHLLAPSRRLGRRHQVRRHGVAASALPQSLRASSRPARPVAVTSAPTAASRPRIRRARPNRRAEAVPNAA